MYNMLRQKDKLEEKLVSFQVLVDFKVDFSFNTVIIIIENSFRSVSFCTAAACVENFKASRKNQTVLVQPVRLHVSWLALGCLV